MTSTVKRRCRRPTCRREFVLTATDLIFCPACRQSILAIERSQGRFLNEGAFREMEWYASEHNTTRSQWDARVIDENGREVWALDLAKRYLGETQPRPA